MLIRRANERGNFNFGWLDTSHTFSFGHYYDPKFMGYESLRVINDDKVRAGAGFQTHGHQDMEIVSYVLEGALAHKDSMGNDGVIRPGEVQRMSAGTGVTHSEFNHDQENTTRFLQIWFLPAEKGTKPGYEQKAFSDDDKRGQLKLVASQQGRQDSITIGQDVDIYAGLFNGEESATHQLKEQRKAWLHLARGNVRVNGQELNEGDGAAFAAGDTIEISNGHNAEVLVFDMAPLK
ncbi:quercetin 2,3-dioxygenase [Kangiella profundi]|uniref:Quercetin 2,3-dioxygenase n=1 Tax=Kangiella profundi TaxID=1561924 RepID=A0A2K9A5S3_9GAMM|nr:pirin family protein [Kangiella profundi]AUD79195.1 quercetin 2,3-dioxygenase [Kangiella profundi]GGF00686.1 pirin family protein [Kangiella profundi]